MKFLACVLFLSGAIAQAQCTSSTSGNVTLQRCLSSDSSNGYEWHFFVKSSDPATRAFRLTLKSSDQGYSVTVIVPRPNATVHVTCPVLYVDDGSAPALTPAPLVSVTVDELQTMNSTAFSAGDGSLP